MGAASPGTGSILAHYNLDEAPAWRAELPRELDEISGLAFTPDGRLFAHGDEEGTIWQLDARRGRVIKRFSLAPSPGAPWMGKRPRPGVVRGDFEDIEIVGDRFFLVSSNGLLVEFREGRDGEHVPFTAFDTGLGRSCEVEGLAFDMSTRSLLLLCKQNYLRAWRDHIVVIAWSPEARRIELQPRLLVPYRRARRLTGARDFYGSAVVLSAESRTLVLIAGPQRTYLELSRSGDVLDGGALDHKAHRQPEGIAFAPDRTLLISDEGAGKRAVLAGYDYRP